MRSAFSRPLQTRSPATASILTGCYGEPLSTVRSLVPMLSGFRDSEGQMTLTTDYETVYSNLRLGRAAQLGLPADWMSQFQLPIRTDEVVTATIFSPIVGGAVQTGFSGVALRSLRS